MPEMRVREPGFTYNASGPYIKNKKRIQKFKETGDSWYIYQNELNKAYFQHDMDYGDFKDLTRRVASNKILRGKAFNIAKNPKYDRYLRGLSSMVYKFFDEKASGSSIKNEDISNKELAEELHKSIIRKFNKGKVHSYFTNNIWDVDLANTQLISKFDKWIRFLLCVTDIFSKYAWGIPLKDKKGITITNAFHRILKESNRKQNKIWADKGSKFYNRSMKLFSQNNNIEMHSTHNEGKSILTERFIRTFKE